MQARTGGSQATESALPARLAERLQLMLDAGTRNGRRCTINQVAIALGGKINRHRLAALSRGEGKPPRTDELELLAEFFGVDLAYLILGRRSTDAETAERTHAELLARAGMNDTGATALLDDYLHLDETARELIKALAAELRARSSSAMPCEDSARHGEDDAQDGAARTAGSGGRRAGDRR